MGQIVAYALLAGAAGLSFVMQQVVNADLKTAIGSTAWAGFVSYLGGTLCMLVGAIAMREMVPAIPLLAATSWWQWTGGLFGAVYIAISIFLVPKLGTATFVALLVAGQMIGSLLLDHFALFGLPQHEASAGRVVGALLLIGGVVMVRS